MDWPTFIVSMTDSLRWPAVALLAVILITREMRKR